MKSSLKKLSALFATALIAATLSASASAELLSWDITGPGVLSANQTGSVSTLGYNLDPAGYSTQIWTVTTIAADGGNYSFNWDYSGFHAFYQVTAFLNASPSTTLVNTGPNDCCSPPSSGFDYSGTYTFTGVNAGDTLSFTMGGSNFDSDNRLIGTLTLDQTSNVNVPEPASLALLGLGMAGLEFSRRRKQKLAA